MGEEHAAFGVHEDLLRVSSLFFDNAMSGDWQESKQRTVQLPEDEPKIFALYVHWLYFGTLPVFCDEPGVEGDEEYLDLVKAYVLGDKLLDSKFQDTAVDAIVEKSVTAAQDGSLWYPGAEPIEYAYRNTNTSARIRGLLVDMYVCFGRGEWLHDWDEPTEVPQPFLWDLSLSLLDGRDGSQGPIVASKYHIHGSLKAKGKV